MKDEFKRQRKILRPCWSWEFSGKADKKVNRRIVRKRMKRALDKREDI